MSIKRNDLVRNFKKDYIIEMSLNAFLKKGVDNTTIEDIAKETSYTKKTIYSYFKSKEEIYVFIGIKAFERIGDKFDSVLTVKKTGIEKIFALMHEYRSFYSENPNLLVLLINWDMGKVDFSKVNTETYEKFKNYNERAILRVENALKLGIEDGTFRPDVNVHCVVSHFLYLLRTTLYQSIIGEAKECIFYFSEFVKLFLKGLENNGSFEKFCKFHDNNGTEVQKEGNENETKF